MNQPKKAYGLLTAVAMIIGIVVGSGIYFKADDILTYTGGSLALGLLVLSIGASNIVFGSLSLSEFAKLETSSGGVVAYLDRFITASAYPAQADICTKPCPHCPFPIKQAACRRTRPFTKCWPFTAKTKRRKSKTACRLRCGRRVGTDTAWTFWRETALRRGA